MVKYGVKETCEVIEFGVKITQGIQKSTEDNEWNLRDALNFVDAAKAAIPAIQDVSQVPKELGDIDESEKATIKAKVEELVPEVEGDDWEIIANEAISAVISIFKIVETLKKMKEKKENEVQ